MHFPMQHFYHLLALFSMLAVGAFTFTNSWFTADEEQWSSVSVGSDTSGVLTFRNTAMETIPEVILVPVDASFVSGSANVAAVTATQATIAQTSTGVVGKLTIIVRRRR